MKIRLTDSPPKEVEQSEFYKAAQALRDTIELKDDKDYAWIFDYSLRQFDMIKDALDGIDAKADQLIRYLGVGTAAAGIGLANSLATSNPLAKSTLIVGILLAIVSIYCALRVRFPSPQAYPVAISQLFLIRDHYERTDHAKGYAATIVALAIEDRAVISQMKGIWLKRAYRWFNVALFAFAVIVPLCHFWGEEVISLVRCLLSHGGGV